MIKIPYKDLKKRREYYQKNREEKLEYQRNYQKRVGNKRWSKGYKNDEQFRKKRQIRDKTIKIVSLKNQKCEICRRETDLHRHHPNKKDINKDPYIYGILCRKCHNKLELLLKNSSKPL